ncbi:MAG: hypothetical protein ACKVHE_02500, partial [Planctomycetales bacterium]
RSGYFYAASGTPAKHVVFLEFNSPQQVEFASLNIIGELPTARKQSLGRGNFPYRLSGTGR